MKETASNKIINSVNCSFWGSYTNYDDFHYYDLTPETCYELCFTELDNDDHVIASTTFTTPAKRIDQRKISDNKEEAITTGSTPRISLEAMFSGNIDKMPTIVTYFYKKNDSYESWNKEYRTVSSYSASLSRIIDVPEWNTTYEYAITISDDSVNSPDDVTTAGWKLTGLVTIPKVDVPASITLSKEKLYLNSESSNYNIDEIKINVTPATASKDFVVTVEPANSNVINYEYNQKNGSISVSAGSSEGSTKLIVKSAHEETVKAECSIEVAAYGVYFKEDEKPDLEKIYDFSYEKNSEVNKIVITPETWHLYKIENGLPVSEVEGFKVTSKNESIAKWRDSDKKFILGNISGRTELVFSDAYGNFKAEQYITIYSYVTSFGISGLKTSSSYEAIYNEGVYTIANGNTYTPIVEEVPNDAIDNDGGSNLKWEVIDGENYVSVSSTGTITPKSPGSATIRASYPDTKNKFDRDYPKVSREIKVNVVDIPAEPSYKEIYVLANTVSKLSNINCPDGWAWKNPDTAIFVNNVNVNSYSYKFDVVSTDETKYPIESSVTVYVANVTGFQDPDAKVGDDIREDVAFELSEKLTYTVKTNYVGSFKAPTSADDSSVFYGYKDYKIEINPVRNLTIQPVQNTTEADKSKGIQGFEIQASRAGVYTLQAVISATDSNDKRKVIAQTSYKIKAVSGELASDIEIKASTGGKSLDITRGDDNSYSFNVDTGLENAVKSMDLEAIVKKISYNTTETSTEPVEKVLSDNDVKLTWKSSDTSVARITVGKDTRKATVKIVGEGHTIITAATKDEAGRSSVLKLEIRNHAPRTDVSSVTVNTAYDYTDSEGQYLAYLSSGAIEIVPVYGEEIKDVKVYDGDVLSSTLDAYSLFQNSTINGTNRWVIGTKNKSTSAKTGNYKLNVTTNTGKDYSYTIKITVVNKPAKITAKNTNIVNLFYRDSNAGVQLNISGTNDGVESVVWNDKSSGVGNGFMLDGMGNSQYLSLSQEDIILNRNKLADNKIVQGTFTVNLYGYHDKYEVPYTIKWNYIKPSIVTKQAITTISPSMQFTDSDFYFVNKTESDKTNEQRLSYSTNSMSDKNSFNTITWDNRNVTLTPNGNNDEIINYTYNGKLTGSERVNITLKSAAWREPLTAIHTIKLVKPTAALTVPQVAISTAKIGEASTNLYVKNVDSSYTRFFDNISIVGRNANSAKLLTENLLSISSKSNGEITVRLSRPDITEKEIKAATYLYKITSYYTDSNGNSQAFNTVNMGVRVINKDVIVNTRVKGSLDLVKSYDSESCNYIEVTPVFSNIGSDYSVTDAQLIGEYSEYFDLVNKDDSTGKRRLIISDRGVGKLKAKQKYKLQMKYTVKMPYGDTFTITSKAFTIAPLQTIPRLTVTGYDNHNTLFAGSDVERRFIISTPSYKYNGYPYYYPYQIEDASGSIDCNKDGTPDIIVEKMDYDDGYYDDDYSKCNVRVRINDKDAVLAASGRGRTYSIPVTVKLVGRDGISRDASTTIRVIVKR